MSNVRPHLEKCVVRITPLIRVAALSFLALAGQAWAEEVRIAVPVVVPWFFQSHQGGAMPGRQRLPQRYRLRQQVAVRFKCWCPLWSLPMVASCRPLENLFGLWSRQAPPRQSLSQ